MPLRAESVLCIAMTLLAGAESSLRPGSSVIHSDSAKSTPTNDESGIRSVTPASGTAPLIFDGNRIYAQLTILRPDGTLRKAFAFVDLGSPSTVLSPALSKELQLDQKKRLRFRVGDMEVDVDSDSVTSDPWLPYSIGGNRKVEVVLPAGVMSKYQVVIDYAQRTLTFAKPGALHPEGIRVPIRINRKTGLIAVDSKINGKLYPITIDSGSAYTWVRKSTAREWLDQHRDWERGTGAVGASNMRMADDGIEASGTLLRIPAIDLGSLSLHQVGALAIGPSSTHGDLIDWYSRKNPEPVIGWLGGNVLRGFRIAIDYPNHASYWLRQTALDPHDLDQIGLTLALKDGYYFVAAIASKNGKPAVEGVQIGDKLLQVDDLQLSNSTWGAIFSAMHGKPGDMRILRMERNGETFTAQPRIKEF
jgi:hypothetical protein